VTVANLVGSYDANRPLAGRRIVLTRPRDQAGDFVARVMALGGTPVIAPAIAITEPSSWSAADEALLRLGDYDWVAFTSVNAVRALANRARDLGLDAASIGHRRIAAVGPATAAALEASVRAPDVVASVHGADTLAGEIPVARDARVLFPCGAMARDALSLALRERGALVDDVVVYRTVAGEGVPMIADALRDGSADAVLFTSPSAVSFVAQALDEPAPSRPTTLGGRRVIVFCLGPTTEAAARASGFEPAATARAATQNELIDEVARWFAPAPLARHSSQ
jgi:uroporphyrinogen III methyltransferase/synthase